MREDNLRVSDCCGAEPRGIGDNDTEDFGICPDCREHCEYIEYCEDCDEDTRDCKCDKTKI